MKKFSLLDRLKSFKYASDGVGYLFRTQHNIWIHTSLAVLTIVLGFIFDLSTTEWCFVSFAIGLVFAAEVFNTAIEVLTDMVSPGYNEKAKIVKDLAAAGVLFAAATAVVTGAMIFGPRVVFFLTQ